MSIKIDCNYNFREDFIKKQIDYAIERAISISTNDVKNKAQDKCPVDTGLLINSITDKVEKTTGYVFTNVEYAPFVELRTPFLRPALYENKVKISSNFYEQLRKVLK